MQQHSPASIGDAFKRRRAEMNLSLKEAENATSIRMTYLQAIEEGQIGQALSPVYARGFVKKYANFLGLDGDQIADENPQLFATAAGAQEFSYGIGTLEMRETPGAGVRWLPNLLWAGATVVILVSAWYLAKYVGIL